MKKIVSFMGDFFFGIAVCFLSFITNVAFVSWTLSTLFVSRYLGTMFYKYEVGKSKKYIVFF